MIERLRALGLILERMSVLYDRVFDLLERERNSLIRLDYEALYQELREKDEILQALRSLDRDRLRIQDQFATVMGLDPAEVTLLSIGESLKAQGGESSREGERLLFLRDQVRVVVDRLSHRLQRNRTFIEKSVENLRGIAENLSQAVVGRAAKRPGSAAAPLYTGKARFQDSSRPSGTLLEKRL